MFKKVLFSLIVFSSIVANQSRAMFFPWDEWDKEDAEKQILQGMPVAQISKTRTPMPSSRKIAEEMKVFLERPDVVYLVKSIDKLYDRGWVPLILDDKNLPHLFEAIRSLEQKFELSPAAVLLKRPRFSTSVNIKNILVVDEFLCSVLSDEELNAVLSHEMAHRKKKHPEILFALGTFCSVSTFSFLILSGIVSPLWGVILTTLSVQPFAFSMYYLFGHCVENEADQVGSLINKDAKNMVCAFIKMYFAINECQDKLKPTIEENIECIEQREAGLIKSIERFLERRLEVHPPLYDRIHALFDLEEQLTTKNKSTGTIAYEKYAMVSKLAELRLKFFEMLDSILLDAKNGRQNQEIST